MSASARRKIVEQYQTIEQLTARVRELEEEKRIAELIAELEHIREQKNLLWFEFSIATQQLAAEQLNNKRLRDALIATRNDLELRMRLTEDDSLNISNSVLDQMLDAIDITASTEALDAYVAEKVKKETTGHVEDIRFKNKEIEELRWIKMARFNNEDCWIYQGDGEDHLESLSCPVVVYPSVLIELTRQRDLAVEWLERCAAHVRPTATIFYEEIVEAINAIKESEAK